MHVAPGGANRALRTIATVQGIHEIRLMAHVEKTCTGRYAGDKGHESVFISINCGLARTLLRICRSTSALPGVLEPRPFRFVSATV